MRQWQCRAQIAFPALIAMLIALTALAQSADELVALIQQDVEDVQLEIRVNPTGAEETLARQRERLESLREVAPDHPLLPSLERRIDELGEDVAAAQAAQSEAVTTEEQFLPVSVPADVRMQLRDVEQLQTLSDREMMRGRTDIAAQRLDEAEILIGEIEDEYADQIPPGYAALIVAKERLAALRDQLDRRQAN